MIALWLLAIAMAAALPGGPLAQLGAWLDARARRKSLRLLNSIAYFAWDQAADLTP